MSSSNTCATTHKVIFNKNALTAEGTMTEQSITSGTTTALTANANYTMGTADVTLYAQWTAISRTVTATAGAHGSISPATQSVNHGATASLTITPEAGYTASITGTCPVR